MNRVFCDICKNEITDENKVNFYGDSFRMSATLKGKYSVTGKDELKVEVKTALNGVSNAGDFCKYCVLDALYKLDDRPKLMERPETPEKQVKK